MSEVIKKAATNEVVEFLYGDLRERSAPVIFNSATGNPVVFNDGANGLPIKSLKVNFSPIQNGSGDPSPENIRSIVPWEGLTVWNCGANTWNEQWEVGTINIETGEDAVADNRIRSKDYSPCVPNKTYFIVDPMHDKSIRLFYYDEDKNFVGDSGWKDSEIITPSNAYFFRFIVAASYGTEYKNDIAINYPATETEYEAHHITETGIEFSSSVYGGYVDIVTGEVWATIAEEVVDGSQQLGSNGNLQYGGVQAYFAPRIPKKNAQSDAREGILCDRFSTSQAGTSYYISGRTTNGNIYFNMPADVTTKEEAQTWFESNNTQVIYIMDSPVLITTLMPPQLQSLLGNNAIWSDANGDIEVEYRADTGLFLKQNTVKDVQINSTSILNNGVANVPMAGTDPGVVKINSGFGIYLYEGALRTSLPTLAQIQAGNNNTLPLTVSNQHNAVFYGLAKVAGVDMAESSNAVGTYTDSAKTAIQKMFGFDGILGDYELSTTASKAYAIGETFIFNGNRYRATTAIAINDVLAPGTNCELDPIDGHYVRDTDYATDQKAGIVKVSNSFGLQMTNNSEALAVQMASISEIKRASNYYKPIVPASIHQAAFFGLAKAANADMASISDVTVGQYPQAQKTAIQTMLGIEADIPLVETVTGSTVSITGMPNVRYICDTAISELTITPPASGSIVVRFTAGSNCIVSLPQTVKLPAWFDISSLEDGTTYEIIITDGVYGGVMSWA